MFSSDQYSSIKKKIVTPTNYKKKVHMNADFSETIKDR